MKIAEAYVELRVDTRKARADAVAETKKIGSEMSDALRDAFSAVAFTAAINSIIGQASRLEQSIGAVESVFGDAKGAVEQFAKTSAQAYGISAAAARELTSQTGALLKGLGMTTKEAADQSVVIARLGADLSAAFGGRPEEAVQALGAALRGEFNPAERFGVSLTAISVATKAVEMGLADTVTEVDGYARAQATLALITEQTADVQGQFARESDTAAGAAARARAEFENQRAELGQDLLPVYGQVVSLLSDVAGAFTALPGPIQTVVIAMGGLVAMAGPVGRVVDTVKDVGGAMKNATPFAMGLGSALGIAAVAAAGYAAEAARSRQNTMLLTSALAELGKQSDDRILGDMARVLQAAAANGDDTTLMLIELGEANRGTLQRVRDLLAATTEQEHSYRGFTLTLEDVDGALAEADRRTAQLAADTEASIPAIEGATGANKDLAAALDDTANSGADVAASMEDIRSRADRAAERIGFFQQALEELRGGAVSLEESNRALRDGIDAITAAATENGATLDINTEKGRRNREVIQQQVDAIFEHAEAMIESGSSMKEAGDAADGLREMLIGQMEQLGFTRAEAEDYITTLGLTPENVETAVKLTKTEQAKADIEDILDDIPGEIPTEIRALIDEGQYAEALRQLEALEATRTVTVNVRYNEQSQFYGSDSDGDGRPDAFDAFPNDPSKRLPLGAGGSTPVIGSTGWWQSLIGMSPSGGSSGGGAAQADPVQEAFDQAAADQRRIETRQARRRARREAIATAMDPEASPAEKKRAEQAWADAIFDDLDARANARGIEDRTVQWANFMRNNLGAAMKKYPFLRDEINVLLAGIPDFSGSEAGGGGGGSGGGGGGGGGRPKPGRGRGRMGSVSSGAGAGGAPGGPFVVYAPSSQLADWLAREMRNVNRSNS